MSAAFDTLDHITLLHRLQHTFGLSGYAISWICSYLTDRSSFVKIDSSFSPSTTILTGVPQGSVLGPLLFVLFISPIANVINPDQSNQNNTVSFHQYADDTQLYIGTNSSMLTTQTASIESCTQRVHNWLLNNGLHLNPSKSEAIVFYNPRSKPLAALAESIGTVSVAGSPIKLQTSIKNLGVYLDSKTLTPNQVLGKLLHLKRSTCLNPDTFLPIFLQSCAHQLSIPLSIIFTTIFDRSEVPAPRLTSTIIPLFKKGDRNSIGNYRPISLDKFYL